jgi:acetolactate synthase I/III small subunit
MSKHILSVLVDDTPGTLTRVTALFSRGDFNIESLAAGATEHPGTSRITLVVDTGPRHLGQIRAQLEKLVNVLEISELKPASAVQRKLMLVKVRTDDTHDKESRSRIVEIIRLFHAKTVDLSPGSVTVEATGTADKLEAMLDMLKPFGISELVQSGTIAMGRGSWSMTERPVHSLGRTA